MPLLFIISHSSSTLTTFSSSFQNFTRGGLSISLSTERVTSLDSDTRSWLLDLTERNMRSLYEDSSWGWNEANKKDELFDDRAW